jgi:F-box/leucine-rich repeat protein 6
MDEGDLERILKHANKLRLLDVRGCSRIGDSGMVRLCACKLKLETSLINYYIIKIMD